MKDDYVSLRLPVELARALTRWARARGLPKSAVVREAVARYLGSTAVPERGATALTARELAARWRTMPHLTLAEAEEFAADIAAARAELPPLPTPWE
jgi:predicted transcriptional regulator